MFSIPAGRRPDTTHVYDLHSYFRNIAGNFTTLPQYFKQHGYITAGIGKVFPPGPASGGNDPPSWTEPYYHAPNLHTWHYSLKKTPGTQSWISVPTTIHRELPLPDQQIASEACKRLESYARQNKPFFMAVGFHKPHVPFVFPSEFIKYYPTETVKLPPNSYAPHKMPEIAWNNPIKKCQLFNYDDIKISNYTGEINSSLASSTMIDLRRAYYSCVTYMDAMVGQVIDKLYELGLGENTIISFLGDHGYHLGEHGEWGKRTNFELATRIPMMVHMPGKTNEGLTSDKLVEAVDLYPTIVDAAGLPSLPLCPVHRSTERMLCREGGSLMPIIANQSASWKTAVFSQYPRKLSHSKHGKDSMVMGYSIRTRHFRYVLEFNNSSNIPPIG